MKEHLHQLAKQLTGSLFFDDLHKTIYATDASVYRKIPLAVAYPNSVEDIKELISFATRYKVSLIPRTAGTSLAGQCVGEGIV
ncbi:MAG: FAD/FMN-containing dehydrogenase, partial [Patiriisocius sp.]